MVDYYPSSINASAGVTSIISYVNDVTGGWIARIVILAFGIIVFMGYLKSKSDDDFLGAFAVGSYASFVVGFLLFLVDIVDGVTLGFAIGLTIISTAWLIFDKRA